MMGLNTVTIVDRESGVVSLGLPEISLALDSVNANNDIDCIALDIENQSTSENKPRSGNSKVITVFLILNTMIGSGILNQPQVFSESGIIGALILFGVSTFFIWLGLAVLVQVGVQRNILDFSGLAQEAFGNYGKTFVNVAILINSFGALLSYVTVVGGTSTNLLQSWGFDTYEASSEYSITPFIMLVFVLPLCLYKSYGHLGAISTISIASITAVLFLVIIGGPFVKTSGSICLINSNGMFKKMGSIIFALACSSASFHAFSSMTVSTIESWREVTTWSVSLGAVMCCIMGISGYLVFKDTTSGNILDNFLGSYADFFKSLLVLHLCLYIPVDFVIMRHSIVQLMGEESMMFPSVKHFSLTICLLAVTTAVVLFLRSAGLNEGAAFGLILDFTGGVAGAFLSFVMPAGLFLRFKQGHRDSLFWQTIAMLVFGLFVMICVPVTTILDYLNK